MAPRSRSWGRGTALVSCIRGPTDTARVHPLRTAWRLTWPSSNVEHEALLVLWAWGLLAVAPVDSGASRYVADTYLIETNALLAFGAAPLLASRQTHGAFRAVRAEEAFRATFGCICPTRTSTPPLTAEQAWTAGLLLGLREEVTLLSFQAHSLLDTDADSRAIPFRREHLTGLSLAALHVGHALAIRAVRVLELPVVQAPQRWLALLTLRAGTPPGRQTQALFRGEHWADESFLLEVPSGAVQRSP
jgi:hypothetical protein